MGQYYALGQEGEPVFMHLGDEPGYGRIVAMAVNQGVPSTVYLDDKKLAGSVFRGMLKTELGLPIRHPQWVELDEWRCRD